MKRIFIHGFMGVATPPPLPGTWHTPTLAGHARTPCIPFAAEAARLAGLIDSDTVVCGYSMGGRLALAASAINTPRRLVLIGAHPGLDSPEERQARHVQVRGWGRLLSDNGLPAFVDMWEALPLFETQRALSKEVQAQQRRARLSHSSEGIAAAAEHLGVHTQPNLWPSLESLSERTHYIAGELDLKYVEVARRAALLGVSIEVAQGAGHNVLLEAPGVIHSALELAA